MILRAACLVLAEAAASAAWAAEEPRLSLPSLIEELLRLNPEIKAAKQRWEKSKAVDPQVQSCWSTRCRARCTGSDRTCRSRAS
jgi:hypothetical protein